MSVKVFILVVFGISLILADPIFHQSHKYHYELETHKPGVDLINFESVYTTKDTIVPAKPSTTVASVVITTKASHGKVSKWHNAVHRWSSLKNHTKLLFVKVKYDWQRIKKDAHLAIGGVKKSYFSARNRTLELINEAEDIYTEIVIDGKRVFHEFDTVVQDIEQSIHNLKADGGDLYDNVKRLVDQLKAEVEEVKDAVENADLTKLKEKWHLVRHEWDSLKNNFTKLYDDALNNFAKAKNDTKVSINGAKKDLKDIKAQTEELFTKTKETYKAIIVDGKDSYEKFKALYQQLNQIFEETKPYVGDVFGDIKSTLDDFKAHVDKHEAVNSH